MHAYPHNITAVTDPKPLGGSSITAAMAHEGYRPISHLMAASGLAEKLKTAGKLSIAEIDAALMAANVPSERRIELKSALARLGIIN